MKISDIINLICAIALAGSGSFLLMVIGLAIFEDTRIGQKFIDWLESKF